MLFSLCEAVDSSSLEARILALEEKEKLVDEQMHEFKGFMVFFVFNLLLGSTKEQIIAYIMVGILYSLSKK